ncbi:hypothetical protein EJD97_002890 [Solanum chilense]|uniref:ARGOS-like protein n=1 Tax=Solanum chilense TaxID=4083 RepID=A0A6N2BX53_SOLCI|nr:hypothetical protein EJD97_002890 [Solanum chilense]
MDASERSTTTTTKVFMKNPYNSRRSTNGKKVFSISYFSLESFLLLICLSASLLLLPLILPPLPPPPFMLLLLPIFILSLLMFLAFMPSNIKNVSYKYV